MNVESVRKDFPIFEMKIDGKPIVYLDNACQTLRPRAVTEAITRYYNEFPACAGRSLHKLATRISLELDSSRERIAKFTNAEGVDEICFSRNCTEAINTVLFGLGLERGDVVLATDREHNSVHVPLLMLRDSVGIRYEFVPSRQDETFDLERFNEMMTSKVKLVAMCHTSNVNGTTIPAKEICEITHDRGALVLLDGAQYVPYGGVDLELIGADFYAFSCHKLCGPSGIGVLYGREELLKRLRPLTYGGHGVTGSTRESTELLPPPYRFEAGLQNYAGIVGGGVAAEYVQRLGREDITEHVRTLNRRATGHLKDMENVSIISPEDPDMRGGMLSFNVDGYSSHDVAMILDHIANIMIRSGMHCVHSWFNDRGIDGCARASFYLYNTLSEADMFAGALAEMTEEK